jgi:hypothetical protein
MTAIAASPTAREAVQNFSTAHTRLAASPLATSVSYNFSSSNGSKRSGNVWIIKWRSDTGAIYTLNGMLSPDTTSVSSAVYNSDFAVNRFAAAITGRHDNGSSTYALTITFIPCT